MERGRAQTVPTESPVGFPPVARGLGQEAAPILGHSDRPETEGHSRKEWKRSSHRASFCRAPLAVDSALPFRAALRAGSAWVVHLEGGCRAGVGTACGARVFLG